MPSIVVNDKGHILSYEDSGSPVNDSKTSYTTLILFHGTGFHGAIFKRLVPFASKHNLRLVLVNRRDYPGSSAYSEEELDQLTSTSNEAHMKFAIDRGLELATFIDTFIKNENIQEPLVIEQADGSVKRGPGGVVVLGWSAGNVFTVPLLAYAEKVPVEKRLGIEPYLKSLIIFDAPSAFLGRPVIAKGTVVLGDYSISFEERVRQFSEWVGAYYVHPNITSRDPADLLRLVQDGTGMNTMNHISVEELTEMTDFVAASRSDIAFRTAKPSVHIDRIRKAIFNDTLAKYFPRCSVDVIWCENTTCASVDAAWGFEEEKEKASREGINGRPFRILLMPGANHFPHWDQPEKTMEYFAKVITSS